MWGVPLPTLQWSVPHFSHCYKLSLLQAHWGRWPHTHLLRPACLFTLHLKECPSPTLQGSMPHFCCCYTLSPLQDCWASAAAPAFSHRLVYLQFEWGVLLPHSSGLRVPRPLCLMSFFFQLLVYFFLFFPWVGVSLSRGLCWCGPGLYVGVPHAT
jgi:hypothetical protein